MSKKLLGSVEFGHRSHIEDVIDGVAELLEPHGLALTDDGKEDDGFVVVELHRIGGSVESWVAVEEREPEPGKVVLGRWKDGAVRVVNWTPKRYEGTKDGSIWFAHTVDFSCGLKEWPTHWAEILPL